MVWLAIVQAHSAQSDCRVGIHRSADMDLIIIAQDTYFPRLSGQVNPLSY